MKNTLLIIIALIITAIYFSGCKLDSTRTIVPEDGQRVVAYIMESDRYLFKQSNYRLKVEGMVIASPLPRFDHFKIDQSIYNSAANYSLKPGYIHFYLTPQQASDIHLYNSAYFEVSTDFGHIFGNQSRPPLIIDIKINGTEADYSPLNIHNAQIVLSDKLEVSWDYNDEKPDFLWIYGYYSYHDGFTDRVMKIDEYVRSSVSSFRLFNTGVLQWDGRVNFNIEPYNGPIPTNGSASNMSGDGHGTLYWSHLPDYCELEVKVGSGYFKSQSDRVKEKIGLMRNSFLENIIMGEFK